MCWKALRQVELSEAARAAGAATAVHVLANLVGLAVTPRRGAAGAEGGLLPPTVRAAQEFRRRQPRLLGAATLLVAALFAPLWHFYHHAAEQRAQLEEINERLPVLRAQAALNSEKAANLAALRARVAALQRVAEAKTSWVEFLADLQDRLEEIEDVWLDQLVIVSPASSKIAGRVTGGISSNAPLQLRVQGRLLDSRHPDAKVSTDSHARVRQLLASMADSPFVATVGGERFDNSRPGLLRFDVTLAVSSRHPL